MKPRELLISSLEQYILPELSAREFRFARSGVHFERRTTELKQRIEFQSCRYNIEGLCRFWTHWAVGSLKYEKWHKQQWATKPPPYLRVSADWNLPGWSRPGSEGFELHERTNEASEMNELLRNMRLVGLPFLDSASDLRRTADYLHREGNPNQVAADLYLMLNDAELALESLLDAQQRLRKLKRPRTDVEIAVQDRLRRYFPQVATPGS